ncbi:unnamed protein product, partial [Didymodactylos carnosus]
DFMQLSYGKHTIVGDQGVTLSGGVVTRT